MNLTELRQEVASHLPGSVSRFAHLANPTVPFAAVDHPESINVDSFGMYQVVLPVIVVLSQSDPQSATEKMNDYLSEALENFTAAGMGTEVVSVSPITYGSGKALGAIINVTTYTR